jgi:hypothetical protein
VSSPIVIVLAWGRALRRGPELVGQADNQGAQNALGDDGLTFGHLLDRHVNIEQVVPVAPLAAGGRSP